MNILNFQALIITIVVLGLVVVFINNKLSYVELAFVGFGIFLVVISGMNHVDNGRIFVDDNKQLVTTEEGNATLLIEPKDVTKVEEELPQIKETSGPLDSLSPQELSKRLHYLYYATSHPYQKVSYKDYETHADKVLNEDNSSLAPDDSKYHNYLLEYYPELTKNQVSARDCLNGGFGEESCYQHPKFFKNLENSSILKQGVNQKNKHHVLREDFSSQLLKNQDSYQREIPHVPECSLIDNSPSNPNVFRLINNDLCRGCTVGEGSSNTGCTHQNELFL
jgi:hypothetical protein